MYKYLLCLDKRYDVKLGEDWQIMINNYDTILDNLVNLLRDYGVDDEEIIDAFKDDTSVEIEEVEE